jgi:DTW domain-containing protein YfiP
MASEGHTAARGYRLLRCSTCYLPPDVCICACTPTIHTSAQFWLLLHPDECRKPTNTARLIGASIPHTRFFLWYRTVPPAELIALLTDCQFTPYLLVPHGDATLFEGLRERPWLPDRVPAFVLLDGTWSQARKMLHRSPYLQGIPRLAIQPRAPSTYRLRCQRCAQHLSTVEVAIALLAQLDEMTASHVLHAYFRVFAERSMAARHGHPLKKSLPEMAQLLAYNSHAPQPDPGQFPLPPGEG